MNRLRSLIAKVKVRKLRILHWLGVIFLSFLLVNTLVGNYANKDKHIMEAQKNKQLIVFDLEKGEIVNASVLTGPSKKKDGKTDAPPPVAAPKKSEMMLIVGNLGLNNNATEKAIALPQAVVLSFSPYAEASYELSQRAKEKGHNVLVDLPVQMKDSKDNAGNLSLNVENTEFRNRNNFEAVISRVYEPAGVLTPPHDLFTLSNNFMPILNQISLNKLFLIYAGDSEDIDEKAKDTDVDFLKVDVVLDEAKNSEDIAKQISNAEALAAKSGYIVVVVRSPSPALVDQIGKWTGTLKAKNITLVTSGR